MDIRSFFGGKGAPKRAISETNVEKGETSVCSESEKPAPSPALEESVARAATYNSQYRGDSLIPVDLQEIITWGKGEPVPYSAVATAFDKIAANSGRLVKESVLSKLYRAVTLTTPEDLVDIVYLTSNKVFPAYDGMELGIGDALLVKAVVEATGRNRAAVQADYQREGDLGIVACQSRASQSKLGFGAKPKPLTARFVLEQLRLITRTTGSKSMDRKVGIIKKMMVACQGDEAKYIVRALQGKLRIGKNPFC